MRAVARGAQSTSGHFKDSILNQLAQTANVAQFVSFTPGPNPRIRHARISGRVPLRSASVVEAVGMLLEHASDRSVNVRSFDPDQPRGHEFIYALTEPDRATAEVRRLAADGLYTIVNETVGIDDGGVSGVAYAGLVEFAPGDTPRCVDKPGTVSFPLALGLRILETVYGFRPDLDYPSECRVEFSIHPRRRGVRQTHTIIWEIERAQSLRLASELSWPNHFSRLLGDKAFGLLVADAIGLPVPATIVIARKVASFRFGRRTGTAEYWTRTCPTEQVPGHFTTVRGWVDPVSLLASEDPNGDSIASVLAQEGVEPGFSGASLMSRSEAIIEGVAGPGDAFMKGDAPPEPLPAEVVGDVRQLHEEATRLIGPVRLEWVHDGAMPWVVQLHRGTTKTSGLTIYPGAITTEHRFRVEEGLEALRALADRVRGTGEGVVLIGSVGLTSHFGDVLRRARVPSRLEQPSPSQVLPLRKR